MLLTSSVIMLCLIVVLAVVKHQIYLKYNKSLFSFLLLTPHVSVRLTMPSDWTSLFLPVWLHEAFLFQLGYYFNYYQISGPCKCSRCRLFNLFVSKHCCHNCSSAFNRVSFLHKSLMCISLVSPQNTTAKPGSVIWDSQLVNPFAEANKGRQAEIKM